MKLLVFGRTGQVARELERAVPQGWSARFLAREEADLTDPKGCAEIVGAHAPDAVINAAAYTAVDRAEDEPELADLINGDAPGAIARAAAAIGAPLLHVSTDYVFDGHGDTPFEPGDEPMPLGAYGRSKLLGERRIAEAGGNWLVLRTSWVFSAHGSNFVRTMLRLGAERETLRVVDDQIGGPTSASSIARALLACASRMRDGQPGGLYHFAGRPYVSWAAFASAVMEEAQLDCRIEPIASKDYPTPAARPANSRLDCAAVERDFGIARPDWRADLTDVIKELTR
jgi:dTDP-4-dehydrorhamnose reductase